MLKIKDKNNRVVYIINDNDIEPQPIDKDFKKIQEEEELEEDAINDDKQSE